MIIEHALLRVREGQATEFEAAIVKARPLIAASPGFQGIEVRPAIEEPNLYLLIVRWDDVASHRDGFRTSDRYQNWRDLLHHFYEPMPAIAYFGDAL